LLARYGASHGASVGSAIPRGRVVGEDGELSLHRRNGLLPLGEREVDEVPAEFRRMPGSVGASSTSYENKRGTRRISFASSARASSPTRSGSACSPSSNAMTAGRSPVERHRVPEADKE
ncbi:MAG: hypothetical protein ACK5IN_02695, partial [Microbacterium sp.]|uniref:hypothetical protein n=1 Tax=Microbacterium sp. TaxID=51671 RepID=UPI003A8606DA